MPPFYTKSRGAISFNFSGKVRIAESRRMLMIGVNNLMNIGSAKRRDDHYKNEQFMRSTVILSGRGGTGMTIN